MQEERLQYFRKGTFKIEKRGEGEEMVGVTAKFRTKQKQDGNLKNVNHVVVSEVINKKNAQTTKYGVQSEMPVEPVYYLLMQFL